MAEWVAKLGLQRSSIMTSGNSGQDPSTLIRKYANRRLYNTATGRFVTLDGLREMVVAGDEFIVIDARTGKDITASVLTQIIAEQESRGESLLPLDVLRQVISLYDKGLGGQLSNYLNQSLAGFTRNMEHMQRLNEVGRRNLEMLQRSFVGAAGRPDSAPSSPGQTETRDPDSGETPENTEDLSEEMRVLRTQLDAMQRKLDELSGNGEDRGDG